MTPQELKNSIFRLAIQGRLVEQRPEEGTAAELLEKILATKGGATSPLPALGGATSPLPAKSKIAKSSSRPFPPIPDDEKPFDIPESWEWVRLGDVGSWTSGATPSRTQDEYFGGNIPWLKTGDLNDGYVSNIPETITDLALEKTSVRLNPVGSVLMAMYGATIGKLGILKVAATTNQACCACIPYDGMWNKYLFYYLLARRRAFIKMGEGGAQPNISKGKIVNAPIPIPPLAEQKRIVAKIEELLPLIDRYEKAWSKLEDFNRRFPVDMQKSVLQMAIQGKLVDQRPDEGTGEELYRQIQAEKQRLIKSGKIKKEKPLPEITDDEIQFEIPESWKWVRLGDVGSWASGATPSRTQTEYYGGNIPWLKTGDLNDGNVSSIPETITDLALEKTSVRLNPIGSVLMAMYGATIGKLGILQIAATTNQACCACIPYEGMWNKYLFYFLMASRKAFIKMGEGGAQPNISKEKIVNALIPLPPLAEQKRIVAKLEEILPLCERLKESLEKTP